VIETRRPKVVARAIGEPLVLSEDHPEHQRALHATDSAPNGAFDTIPKAVADACDPSPHTDLPPGAAAEDDVNPLACEPSPLVEPTFWLARIGNANDGLEECAARRRSADWEQEQGPFPDGHLAEPSHLDLHAYGPRGRPRRADDSELGRR
jgi:hypothetical protein